MSTDNFFDVLVVGRGLLASASARHLSLTGKKVGLIGPTEHENLKTRNIFASHYDDTRVQRIIAQNRLWTRLNLDSVNTWKSLEDFTGIDFYQESGCIYLNTYIDDYLQSAAEIASEFRLKFDVISGRKDLASIAPMLSFNQEVFGIFEPKLAGSINPRNLVAAQLKAFQKAGGAEINQMVVDVSEVNNKWQAKTSAGNSYFAENILIATGAFSNYFNLIPRPLNMQNKSEVVILAKLSEYDFQAMRDMPSLLFEIKVDDFDGIYLIAPKKMSDGSYVLKMGMNQNRDLVLNDQDAMRDWFTGDSYKSYGSALERELRQLFPSVVLLESSFKPCVISRTASQNPYIGEVDEGLYVLHGCNGYSAMSSDAQGRQAAALINNGKFDEGYLEEDFRVIYK